MINLLCPVGKCNPACYPPSVVQIIIIIIIIVIIIMAGVMDKRLLDQEIKIIIIIIIAIIITIIITTIIVKYIYSRCDGQATIGSRNKDYYYYYYHCYYHYNYYYYYYCYYIAGVMDKRLLDQVIHLHGAEIVSHLQEEQEGISHILPSWLSLGHGTMQEYSRYDVQP